MDGRNQTSVSEFLLLGFSDQPEQHKLLFGLFLWMYMVTMVGNLLIVLVIISDSHLHTPMYLFIANLSFNDMCFISTSIPKMLVNIHRQNKAISYAGCLTQIYFLFLFVTLDNFILAMMAYDRHIAICFPLHYSTIMSPRLCLLMFIAAFLVTQFYSLLHTLLLHQLSFCADNRISHIFCEIYALLTLSCSTTHLNEIIIYTLGTVLFLSPLSFILVSYVYIISAVLKVPSASGRWKAFSTFSSHLSVVTLFYGTLVTVYLRPSSTHTAKDSAATVMYAVVTPMLNPFIYSFKNQDIKGALSKIVWNMRSSLGVRGL
ncbi:olfactory receptor 1D2-like [Sarcophilus harrisii]|uniref:Olfactory receptor n=1 Tax=Sarcophilus harrisii TaxID=9305 RepID=A0A7N4NPZ0_SARHA|nr:olfactory receptor 1D2-like [Sarcophilus harrisii]